MMKKILSMLLGLFVAALFSGTTWYLYQKSKEPPMIFNTISPMIRDIEKVTVASGTIVPHKEIDIKPKLAGIIAKIYVQPGQTVKKGTKLAQIRVVPDLVQLNEAENRFNKARINYNEVSQDLERQRRLYQKRLISQADFTRYQNELKTAQADLDAARKNLRLIHEGVAQKETGENNTLVESTVDGMILEIPVKEGATVVETNDFNAGTTIATIADMSRLVFEGKIDESEVGKIKEGMKLDLTIGALEDHSFKAVLEYIAPKGSQENDGAVQFKIKAALESTEGIFIRAGYSANAKIVLDRRKHVLTLPERVINYDGNGHAYVDLETAKQQFERRHLELGLSDGIYVEILAGITIKDRIKQPQA
jgi:HlyD family secretion protein